MRKEVQTQQFATLWCLIAPPSLFPARTGRNRAAAHGRGCCLTTPRGAATFDKSCNFFLRSFYTSARHFA